MQFNQSRGKRQVGNCNDLTVAAQQRQPWANELGHTGFLQQALEITPATTRHIEHFTTCLLYTSPSPRDS